MEKVNEVIGPERYDQSDNGLVSALIYGHWESYCSNNSIKDVIGQTKSQKLFPYAYSRLAESEIEASHKIALRVEWQRHKRHIDQIKNAVAEIAGEFEKRRIPYVLAKGLALSKVLYGDIYMRQFNDIDFMISNSHIVEACFAMESIGYYDPNISNLERCLSIKVDTNTKSVYYSLDDEKQFYGKNVMVELKSITDCVNQIMVKDFCDNSVTVDIGGTPVRTLEEKNTFLYLLINAFGNFTIPHGLFNDYCFRELVDINTAVINGIADWEWLDVKLTCLDEEYKALKLKSKIAFLLSIYTYFYSCDINDCNFTSILSANDESNKNIEIDWKHTSLTERIIDRNKRYRDIKESVRRRYMETYYPVSEKIVYCEPVAGKEGDKNKTVIPTPYVMATKPLFISIFKGAPLFGFAYSRERLFVKIIIPPVLKNFSLTVGFLNIREDWKKSNLRIVIYDINGKAELHESDFAETEITYCDDNSITVSIPAIDDGRIVYPKSNEYSEFYYNLNIKPLGYENVHYCDWSFFFDGDMGYGAVKIAAGY